MLNPFTLLTDILFLPILTFAFIIKGIALWRAAKKDQTGWFIALLIFQTLGILEIIYLLVFQKGADPKYQNWFKPKTPGIKQEKVQDIEPTKQK